MEVDSEKEIANKGQIVGYRRILHTVRKSTNSKSGGLSIYRCRLSTSSERIPKPSGSPGSQLGVEPKVDPFGRRKGTVGNFANQLEVPHSPSPLSERMVNIRSQNAGNKSFSGKQISFSGSGFTGFSSLFAAD